MVALSEMAVKDIRNVRAWGSMQGSEVIPMNLFDPDPTYLTPPPIRLARPLIQGFCRSPLCPPEHRWHARATLPVLALFVGMLEESSRGLSWEALDPDALMGASLEIDPEEHGFLRDLLDVSASFYGFLAEQGLVPTLRAHVIRARLVQLALGLRSVA